MMQNFQITDGLKWMWIDRCRWCYKRAKWWLVGGWGFETVTSLFDIFQIEALAVLEGLKLVWAQDFRQGEIKSDNTLLIDTLWNGLAVVNKVIEVLMIHAWCSKEWRVKFLHILKDNNKVADCVVKEARGVPGLLRVSVNPPLYVKKSLKEDICLAMDGVPNGA